MKKSEEKKLIAQVKKNLLDYNETPVVTTAQLAAYYECEPRQIQQNFNNNAAHFEEGKHYFKLEGESLKLFKASQLENFELPLNTKTVESQVTNCYLPINKFASSLYLWTKRGAMRHAKMLNTEKAWEVFEMLEDAYFVLENFQQMKMREQSKTTRRNFTDVLKEFIAYAQKQGTSRPPVAFYSKYSTLVNKWVGLPNKKARATASSATIANINFIEDKIAQFMSDSIKQNIPYKDIESRIETFFGAMF